MTSHYEQSNRGITNAEIQSSQLNRQTESAFWRNSNDVVGVTFALLTEYKSGTISSATFVD